MPMKLERRDIEDLLPHRTPILLPEAIDIDTPGKSGTGRLRLPASNLLWDAWDGTRLADELILEGAAQVFGTVMSTDPVRPAGDGKGQRLLLSFDSVEFQGIANPSEEILVEVKVEGRFGAMSVGRFSASQDGKPLATGKIGVMGG